MKRRALVSQTRMPEVDRDRGSQRVDTIIRWLAEDGWSVTFLAEESNADQWHARRLRQHGVATFAGYDSAADVVGADLFDLAVLAFWQPAARLLPVLRRQSPATRVIVDSIDVHFLRDARRRLGVEGELDARFGDELVQELNTYHAADAVLAVSRKEAELLADFLGPGRVHCLPLTEPLSRSSVPLEERRGILFVGNFRHLPNGEAIEYLCRDILPRLDPDLLARHPLTVVGNRLDDRIRAHAAGLRDARMVGWVPSTLPYLERTRVCVVPLLHGAGVKGKVVQALMLGTPVVTTTIGAEGLDLQHDEHVLISNGPGDLAAAITRVLTDDTTWHHLADAGYAHASATHDPERVRHEFGRIVEEVLATPPTESAITDGFRHSRRRALAYRATKAAFRDVVRDSTELGSIVLVVSKGDDELLAIDGRTGWHFPQGDGGAWAGYHPADSESAIRHLQVLVQRGARYLALPNTAFWWLHHYGDFGRHLVERYRRIHADDEVVLFDLGEPARPGVGSSQDARPEDDAGPETVVVVGTYGDDRCGPPPSLVAELERTRTAVVTQHWQPQSRADAAAPLDAADWIVFVNDGVTVPSGFLDDFLGWQRRLGADRAQPPHTAGPAAGPPVTERVHGCVAREADQVTALPVLVVRGGAPIDGPVTLIDATPVGLTRPLPAAGETRAASIRDVVVREGDEFVRGVHRGKVGDSPSISVVIATFDRPDLLAGCLAALGEQTIDRSGYEVIVVDDGSTESATTTVLEQFADRLPLAWVRIDHAGRSAAKNLAVQLARADLVLFFDDDDRPSPSLLEEHVRAHATHHDEGIAILGYTGWAPELTITPVMHYLTEVDKMLFSYGNLEDGQELDWRGFWEGRISCKRSLLLRHGLHDQRLPYSIDVELGMRLVPHGLRVIYSARAVSYMARPVTFEEFCRRCEAKGRAQAIIASLHDTGAIRRYLKVDQAGDRWRAAEPSLPGTTARVRELEAAIAGTRDPEDPRLGELHRCYREAFFAHNAKGIVESARGNGRAHVPAVTVVAREGHRREGPVGEDPELTVTIPIWSRTVDLADMALRTVERVWEVARLATEVIVIDNGSPFPRALPAIVHRFDDNRGVATAWNTGIGMARSPVVAVLNSDCVVEAGWDDALHEAATTGRRIAFPYTDHGDGTGFRQPDQAGTAGWCFMMTTNLYREIGPFDERFNPAYCEDTDYWHRAWELGVELSPVPQARVTHARRTSAATDPHWEWLLQGHRYKYGWKHGVDPLRAPPYYNRPIVEYHCRASVTGARA